MAYIDQRTGRNQRAAIMTIVAIIQGGVIVALINGLAVHFIKPAPIPNPQASDIPVMPLPAPITPPPPKRLIVQREQHPTPQLPLPPVPSGPIAATMPPIPPMPQPSPTQIDGPLPSPGPGLIRHLAKPRGNPGSWATPSDYPARDLREGNQGVTRFSLAIGTDGTVQSCTVTTTSGFPGLDKATCDNVSRRARFEPATDGSGNGVHGTYSGSIRWVIPQD